LTAVKRREQPNKTGWRKNQRRKKKKLATNTSGELGGVVRIGATTLVACGEEKTKSALPTRGTKWNTGGEGPTEIEVMRVDGVNSRSASTSFPVQSSLKKGKKKESPSRKIEGDKRGRKVERGERGK